MRKGRNAIAFGIGWDDWGKTAGSQPRRSSRKDTVKRPYNQQQVDIIGLLGGHNNQLGVAVRAQEKFWNYQVFSMMDVSSIHRVHFTHAPAAATVMWR